jgi:hypothetical protein
MEPWPSLLRRCNYPPVLLLYDPGMACSTCGFDGHNSRTCNGANWDCPNCGKPTARMNDYSQRHDNDYCSPFTSPDCWG